LMLKTQNYSKRNCMTKPIFKIKKSNNKAGILLSVSGDLSVQHALEMKAHFLKIHEEQGDVHVSLDDVTGFDITAFQLTYLLKKEIEQDGRKITIALPVNSKLRTLLEKTGVTKLL